MYFVTTILDDGMIKTRPLPHQKIPASPTDGALTDVDVTLNVGCAKEIRKAVPVGTVFCTKEMFCGYGFYTTTPSVASEGKIYPVSLTIGECKRYGTTDEMIRAYREYCARTGSIGESAKEAKPKVVTYLDTLMAHRGLKPPTIEKNQYYVDVDNWYYLIRCLDRNYSLMITGASGTGKTSLLTFAAKALRKKIYFFDMGSMTDPVTTLLGAHRIKMVDGNQVSVFDRSDFSKAIEEDCIIVLDELSRAPSTALNFLFPLLDHRRELPMQYADGDSDRTIKAHPNCLFLATANIGGEYGGTASLDRALVDRLMLMDIDYMPIEKETELLCSIYSISYDESSKIMSIVASLRDMFKKGDLSTSVSIRYTKMIASMVADGYTLLQSLKLVINPLFEGTDTDGERGKIQTVIASR